VFGADYTKVSIWRIFAALAAEWVQNLGHSADMDPDNGVANTIVQSLMRARRLTVVGPIRRIEGRKSAVQT
jgi:hypothetical protein